jgi:small subunit ribosomal protein S18
MTDQTATAAPAPQPAAPAQGSAHHGGSHGHREGGAPRGAWGRRERRGPRKKVCRFCSAKVATIDIRDTALLKAFLSERGRIVSRRTSGNCAKHQRQITRGVKRARAAALLPYAVI